MNAACPPVEVLRQLGYDSQGSDEFRAIESHVADCARCQERLERFARLDPFDSESEPDETGCSRPPNLPGFALGAELGRGGGGVVYEALQLRIGRRVAVKILSGVVAPDARSRTRWLREARAIGRVRHPNVVQLHEAGEHEGRLYLVLDLVPGGSLKDRASGPIPPRAAAELVEMVARAVAAIHEAGLLHLDIKPSNILLDGPPGGEWSSLVPMLSDFGIAVAEDESGTAETLAARGTPAYMAPEQVTGPSQSIGPKADLFALGATLYALLTGRPPFQAASAIETLDLIRSRDPAAPRALVPGVPRDLETICLKCLHKDPARRYGSASALADDLRRWLDGFPIVARPVSRLERAGRWCRRHPVPSALGVTILVSLVALTALWRRAEWQRERANAALAQSRASESAAREAVGGLVELIRAAVESPHKRQGERLEESLPVVLGLTATLRRTPGLAEAHASSVARLELQLAGLFRTRGESEGARRLVDDAGELLRAVDARPIDDVATANVQAEAMLMDAQLLMDQARLEDAVEAIRRGERILRPHLCDSRVMGTLVGLPAMRVVLARWFVERGDTERARRVLDENVATFCELARQRPGDPAVALLASLVRIERDQDGSAIEATVQALRLLPEGERLPPPLESLAGYMIAIELRRETESGAYRRLDPEAVADALLGSLDARFAGLGSESGSALICMVVQQLGEQGSLQAIEARRAGRLDDVRWTIGWMHALSHAYGRRDPESDVPHLVRSRAFVQENKLGWLLNDREMIERNLREALTEATIALAIEPDKEISRRHVAALRERYVKVVTREPEEDGGAESRERRANDR